LTDELAPRRPLRAVGARRLVIGSWLATVVVALVALYPDALRNADESARANASLDLIDRDVGGGNSVIPDQGLLVEARGRIPRDESFTVALGEPQEGWTDLTAPYAETFATYFLLPRRVAPDAAWILCFACDRGAFPGAEAVWEGDDGLSILRRPT
jgi:hypothetical protein